MYHLHSAYGPTNCLIFKRYRTISRTRQRFQFHLNRSIYYLLFHCLGSVLRVFYSSLLELRRSRPWPLTDFLCQTVASGHDNPQTDSQCSSTIRKVLSEGTFFSGGGGFLEDANVEMPTEAVGIVPAPLKSEN